MPQRWKSWGLDRTMSTEGKICPIISAFSELKQFSAYPKCTSDCAWFIPASHQSGQSTCTLVMFSKELNKLRATVESAGTIQSLVDALTNNSSGSLQNVSIADLPVNIGHALEAIGLHFRQQAKAAKQTPKGPKYYGSRPPRVHLRWAKRAFRRRHEEGA